MEYRAKEGEISGSKVDTSYQKRLHFQSLTAAGLSADSTVANGGAKWYFDGSAWPVQHNDDCY
jgi:hypothetical protein